MAKYCDICNGKIGLKGFHCQDGTICKKCYRIVSNNFSEVITFRTLDELKCSFRTNSKPIDLGEGGFVTTRKIGTFLLIDEKNQKFCIPGNPTVSGKYSRPQIYSYDQLTGFRIVTVPEFSPEELFTMVENKRKQQVIRSIKVRVRIKDEGIQEVPILLTPVRSSTYAFRKSFEYANSVLKELNKIYQQTNQEKCTAIL